MTYLLGIDPGAKGAMAVLDCETLLVKTYDLPADIPSLHSLVLSLPHIKCCTLEQVYAGEKMSKRAVGVMFEQFGAIKSALAWRSIPVETVRPSHWKPALSVPADKTAARRRASEFFPDCADQWPLVKHDGRAEAALIAWYGRRYE